jgi:hypothetical protein
LGLTLAEILVLLVFLLLLACGAVLSRRDKELAELHIDVERYRSLLQPVMTRARLAGLDVQDSDQLVALLVRGKEADRLRTELDSARSALERANAEVARSQGELGTLRAVVAGMSASQRETLAKAADDEALTALLARSGAGSGKPSERVKVLLAKDENLTGQNAQMRAELARLKGNGGSGLPYCWTTLDGRPVYMLRVELQDDGVVVHDVEPRPKPEDRAWSVLDAVARDTLMPVNRFLAETSALQAIATSDKCRYALLAIDATARTNKPGYKMLMGRLWSGYMVHEIPR